jgi:inositol-phosphate phosphatase/L-galactose 1-phosphate phosphatase/histidinol-phosphatase
MSTDEVAELLRFAEELADASRAILAEALSKPPQVETKADKSPVTALDKAVERRVREMIEQRYPRHGIQGEEYGIKDREAEHLWVIDPIDGTGPFIAGIPVFGTLIGLTRAGRPLLGVADHPVTRERWTGAQGLPSRLNGKTVRTRHGAPLAAAMLSSSSPDFYAPAEWERYLLLRQEVAWAVYGGSCYAYMQLASGRIDLSVDCSLDVFDILPLMPIIEGAGGLVTDWAGKPLDLSWKGAVLAAGDPALHAQALRILGG